MQQRVRRTQTERSDATRTRILDATVTTLVELGYAATSTAEVLERAGVSRGSLLHHFPSKVDLLVAAVQHVARRRLLDLSGELADLPTQGRSDALIDVIAAHLSAPIFWAALELWTASRTDAALRAALQPVEAEVFAAMHGRARDLLTAEAPDDPRVGTVIDFSYQVLTGLAMTEIVSADPARRAVLVRRWKRAVEILLGRRDAATLLADAPAVPNESSPQPDPSVRRIPE